MNRLDKNKTSDKNEIVYPIPPFVNSPDYKAEQNYKICKLYFTQENFPSYFDLAIQWLEETGEKISPQRIGLIIKMYGEFYQEIFRKEGK